MQLQRTFKRQQVLIIVAIATFVAICTIMYTYLATSTFMPDQSVDEQVSSATTTPQNELPLELPFNLPKGSRALDEYAYISNNAVYLKSLTGKDPLQIPEAQADSFVRLADFSTYAAGNVVQDCGAEGTYTYYGDDEHLYFYQVWRSPTFRSSQIEVVRGANKDGYASLSEGRITDGSRNYQVGYQIATSTCWLTLNRIK